MTKQAAAIRVIRPTGESVSRYVLLENRSIFVIIGNGNRKWVFIIKDERDFCPLIHLINFEGEATWTNRFSCR